MFRAIFYHISIAIRYVFGDSPWFLRPSSLLILIKTPINYIFLESLCNRHSENPKKNFVYTNVKLTTFFVLILSLYCEFGSILFSILGEKTKKFFVLPNSCWKILYGFSACLLGFLKIYNLWGFWSITM